MFAPDSADAKMANSSIVPPQPEPTALPKPRFAFPGVTYPAVGDVFVPWDTALMNNSDTLVVSLYVIAQNVRVAVGIAAVQVTLVLPPGCHVTSVDPLTANRNGNDEPVPENIPSAVAVVVRLHQPMKVCDAPMTNGLNVLVTPEVVSLPGSEIQVFESFVIRPVCPSVAPLYVPVLPFPEASAAVGPEGSPRRQKSVGERPSTVAAHADPLVPADVT